MAKTLSRQPEKKRNSDGVAVRNVTIPRSDTIWFVVAYGLMLLVMVTPFYRGLFFAKDQLVALICALALFALWWWHKFNSGDGAFVRAPIEWAALALIAAYVLSLFVALNLRSAIQEVLNSVLYFLALWLTIETTRSDSDRKRVLAGIFLAGVAVALFGIGNAAGLFSYAAAFAGNRIASSFQYPNTLASYLTVSSLIGFALQADENPPWARRGIAAGLGVSLLTLVFTYSRGGLLVFPIAVVGLLVVAPRPYRRTLVVSILASSIGAGVAMPLFSKGLALAALGQSASGVHLWGAVLLAILASAGLHLLGERVLRFREVSPLVWGVIATLIVAGGAVAAGRFLAQDTVLGLGKRLVSFSLRDENMLGRFQITLDALKIFRDHPILGTGGGGFAAVYHAYQAYGYTSSQVHNQFAQTLVETGILGFIPFVALWGASLYAFGRLMRRCKNPRTLLLAGVALVGALALGLHGAIDFDLSLSSVSLALWTLWGVVASADRIDAEGATHGAKAPRPGWPAVSAVVVAVALVIFTSRLVAGSVASQTAISELRANATSKALADLRRSATRDPYEASTFMNLGAIEMSMARQFGSESFAKTGWEDVQRGLNLERTNPSYQAAYGDAALQMGLLGDGLQAYEQALNLAPFEAGRYADLAKARVAVAKYYINKGQRGEADQVLAKVIPLAEELAARHDLAVSASPAASQITPASTPALNLYSGEALALLGKLTEARAELTGAMGDPQTHTEALTWLSAVTVKKGGLVPDQSSPAATSQLARQVAEILPLLP